MAKPAQGSPAWWFPLLLAKLNERRKVIKVYEEYYAGDHPLAFASPQFVQVFGGMFKAFADDWTQLVVDAVEERLNIVGFRVEEEGRGDKEIWRDWQHNQLDAGSQMAHVEALVTCTAYASVWNGQDDRPLVAPERASEVVVAHDTATRQRFAALKDVRDEWTGEHWATLYLPDGIYKYKQAGNFERRDDPIVFVDGEGVPVEYSDVEVPGWRRREVNDETWPLENPLEVVPIVPLPNRPRLGQDPVSEIRKIVPLQNAVNKLVADMLVASEFAAFRQRWATGLEIPVDPDTKEPIEVFTAAVNRLWLANPPVDAETGDVVENAHEPKFGEFAATDLRNFVVGVEMLVQHIASQSRTPPHYFFLRGEVPSGESIKSAETGLVAKTRRKMVFLGEAWEEVMRLAMLVRGRDIGGLESMETIWADPESRTEAEHIDAVVKRKSIDVPNEQLWEDAGYTWTQVNRFRQMRRREAIEQAAVAADLKEMLEAGLPGDLLMDAEALGKRVNAAGQLVRSGFEPQAALDAVGLDPIEHLGLLPVTVQDDNA